MVLKFTFYYCTIRKFQFALFIEESLVEITLILNTIFDFYSIDLFSVSVDSFKEVIQFVKFSVLVSSVVFVKFTVIVGVILVIINIRH